ncbi:MAG: signal recognition particle-docking protein FtsY [Anaerolineae bacterium]|nr:signal recognition particle-docking protein FtsY [Anaerolineae bacterium]
MASVFTKWKDSLEKTRKVTFGRLSTLFGATEITNETWDDLEALLLQADVGITTTDQIIRSLKGEVINSGIIRSGDLHRLLHDDLLSRLIKPDRISFDGLKPAVILLVGVNGSGKTTTAAKLGKYFKNQEKTILLGAADTFRAAAVDQLQVWGDRLDIPVIAGQTNADPGSVAYNTVQAGLSRGMDVVLIDTAGRLHTRSNLMEELKKVVRVVGKALPGAPHACWLVLDATTGQNALQQAKQFKTEVNLTGIILAKLDSSSRGGMAFSIQQELGLPILFAGMGENPDDLYEFDRQSFVDGILME